MSLKFALLGFVDRIPASGYQLEKMFSASVTPYWPATRSQIYRTLDELQEEGSITRLEPDENFRRGRFAITELGRRRLLEWLGEPADLPDIRHALLLKMAYSANLTTGEILKHLRDYRGRLAERLDGLGTANQGMIDEYSKDARERLLWQFCLDSGVLYYRDECRLIDDLIQKLEGME